MRGDIELMGVPPVPTLGKTTRHVNFLCGGVAELVRR